MATTSTENQQRPSFQVRILRQAGPGLRAYWELYEVRYERDMNVISVLQQIAATGRSAAGHPVTPVAWECNCLEEVCGACTMIINGRVRQSCSALVDRLLEERPGLIELQPMSKFPVIRDLVIDRMRLFRALKKVQAWIPVDGYHHLGPGPLQSREEQEQSYPLTLCMSCGCCLEACPQFTKVELTRQPGETDEQLRTRQFAAYDQRFVGAHAINQVIFFNSHPRGKHDAGVRLEKLMEPGGIQTCGNAQNCVKACPKEIPLTTSIARAGRATTIHALKKLFDK